MIINRIRIIAAVLTSVSAVMLSGCDHKDLAYLGVPSEIEIVYDWRNAPDANPASMGAYLYDEDNNEPLRYIFSGREGGPTRVPAGHYRGLGMNSDETDWAQYRNHEDIDSFEIYTHESAGLSAYNIPTRAVPRASGTEDEPFAQTPGMLWTDRRDEFYVQPKAERTVLTFYPEEAVCHYTVDVIDIKNPQNMPVGSIDATLSGMSEGFLYGKKHASDTKVTLPFELTKQNDEATSLHGEFLTFGESMDRKNPHKLTVYYILKDGAKHYATFDVSSQVWDAPDPKHVHIVVRGLEFPGEVATGGGLVPDVEEWEEINITIPM